MITDFIDAAAQIQGRSLLNWKKQGKPIVGYTCTYLPAEILHAADILPVRLRGIDTTRLQIGDAYFGPYICSFAKSILQLAGERRFSFLDGVIITPGCDSLRRLEECWRKAAEDIEGILPNLFHYFPIPHKHAAHGVAWFEAEISKLIDVVEQRFNVRITTSKLKQSIALFNRGRRLLARMESLRESGHPLLSGKTAQAITIAATVMPRETHCRQLAQFLEAIESERDDQSQRPKKRLMVLGSICDDLALFDLIEASGKAVVSADNLCFGARFCGAEIDTDMDPVAALARGYLEKPACPRMYGRYKERLAAVMRAIEQANIDGVVMQNIRFCDLHGSENSLYQRDLEAQQIPCLKIEREYGPLVETGRIRMRLEAFLERLGA